jgi:hypothetical protein
VAVVWSMLAQRMRVHYRLRQTPHLQIERAPSVLDAERTDTPVAASAP